MDRRVQHRTRLRRRAGQWLIAFGLVAALVIGLLWYRTTSTLSIDHDLPPFTDVNPFGANFFLDREVEQWKLDKTLEMARAAGIGWIKQQFSWEEIEPHQKGVFDWDKHDRIVDLAERYGMQVIARLDRPPDWAREDDQFKTGPPDSLEDFGDFVHQFVLHFKGRIRYLQIWNEPNLSAEWGFERVDAAAYTRMLEVAYRRAKEADPNVVVLSAPLAITLEDASMRGNHSDLAFLKEMYQAGAGAYFDILSANGFGLDRPPEDAPDPSVLNFRRVELQREIMEENGDTGKSIWINEYGWNASPASFPDELLTWERVTPAEQAEYTVRGITWAREHWPWLGVVNIWYFRQVGDVPPDRPSYYFELVSPEFEALPVYGAVQSATRGLGSVKSGLHQDTSPAVSAPGWQQVLDPEASGGSYLTSGGSTDGLGFQFEGNEVILFTAMGPEQGQLRVAVDGAAPPGLEQDTDGSAVIDLHAEQEQKRVPIAIARDLGPGLHHLEVVPVGPEPVTVDAIEVSEGRSGVLLLALGCLALALVVAGAALWSTGK